MYIMYIYGTHTLCFKIWSHLQILVHFSSGHTYWRLISKYAWNTVCVPGVILHAVSASVNQNRQKSQSSWRWPWVRHSLFYVSPLAACLSEEDFALGLTRTCTLITQIGIERYSTKSRFATEVLSVERRIRIVHATLMGKLDGFSMGPRICVLFVYSFLETEVDLTQYY